MRLISAHAGKLLTLDSELSAACTRRGFATGLKPLDNLLPGGLFARGAVHELLNEPHNPQALTFAMLLARSTGAPSVFSGFNDLVGSAPRTIISDANEAVRSADPTEDQRVETRPTSPPSTLHPPLATVIIDPAGEIYPPAVTAIGLSLDRVYFLQPREKADQLWAIAECLGCSAVGAVVAAPPPLSRIDARKLQLAAERGGGVGILLRTFGQSPHYAAATRWLIRPTPGERTIQRWNIQLLHAPGGQVNQSIILEQSRQTLHLRAAAPQATPARKTPPATNVS